MTGTILDASGNLIVNAPAAVREIFNFNVKKFPLTGPDNTPTPAFGLFRDDNWAFVGSGNNAVTKDYVPHTTDDVVALTEAACTAFECDMQMKAIFDNGHIVSLAPTDAIRKAIYGTADNIFARIHLNFGYQKSSCIASMGWWRDACDNLTIPHMIEGTKTTIRHSGSLRDKMDELIRNFQSLREGWGGMTDLIARMNDSETNVAEMLAAVFGDSPEEAGSRRTRHDNRTKAIVRRIMNERVNTGRPSRTPGVASVWEIYNGIQGYQQHTATRRNSPSRLQRSMMVQDDTHVKKAERVALGLIA
jgi:hypothetical protein